MRHLAAAVALSFGCLLVAASCVQGQEVSETESVGGDTPAIEPKDDEELGGLTTGDVCLAAASGIPAREAFCRSALVPPYLKQSCWAHVLLTRVEWIGWCSLYF
jgi:hypothetical protein